MDLDDLREDIKKNPSKYTYWIREAFEQFNFMFFNDAV